VFVAGFLPLALVALDAARGRLTANPIAEVLNRFGFWTLVFLLLSLAITPIRIVTGWGGAVRYRRRIGLFAFFYACLHFVTYAAVDQFFDLAAIVEDVAKRKFIAVGFVAFVVLIPLAVTSSDRAVRRLGYLRWKKVHRLAYVAGLLGVVHFVWRVKADLREPLIFAAVLAVLLGVRLVAGVTSAKAPPERAAPGRG
jgi:methionine sulfoxide reductase heme-binding subunit